MPTVFIVHNNEDVNTLLTDTFWMKGFQPVNFTDGKECLKRVRDIDGNVDAPR
jgi:FixJ family two-component response regulator